MKLSEQVTRDFALDEDAINRRYAVRQASVGYLRKLVQCIKILEGDMEHIQLLEAREKVWNELELINKRYPLLALCRGLCVQDGDEFEREKHNPELNKVLRDTADDEELLHCCKGLGLSVQLKGENE